MQWTEKDQGTDGDEKPNWKQIMSCTEPLPCGVLRLEGKLHRAVVNESGHAEIWPLESLFFLHVLDLSRYVINMYVNTLALGIYTF